MNAPKVCDVDYIQFLIAAQRVYTCTEAARCAEVASHDAHTRLLYAFGITSYQDCRQTQRRCGRKSSL